MANTEKVRNVRLSKCSVGQEEKDAVCRVLDDAYLGMSKEVQAFEKELKDYFKTDKEVILVNSGSAALHLAATCLDLGPGDEVLIPSITFVASYQSVFATGAKPVACEIDLQTGFIDVKDAEKRITKNTKAIMPVHYASDASALDDVYTLAKKHNLRVIEDAAQSLSCRRKGKMVGVDGDILCISMDGIKNITSGEGGIVITGDKVLAERVRDARLVGVEKDTEKRFSGKRSWVFDVKHVGFRYHMSDVMASIGRAQLRKVEGFREKRQVLVKRYLELLKDIPQIQTLNLNYPEITAHIFPVRVVGFSRDEMANKLLERGVSTGFHYYPNHLLTLFKTSYNLPNAEQWLETEMTLPLHVDLSLDDIDYVVSQIKGILKG